MPGKILANKYSLIVLISGSSLALGASALGLDVNSENISTFLGNMAGNEIAQTGFLFTVAAWLHSGRVKKEIKDNFSSLTTAINNVAESFKQDLKAHSDTLKVHSEAINELRQAINTMKNKGE